MNLQVAQGVRSRTRELIILTLLLTVLKMTGLAFDPTVRLFLGDSASYLHSAMTGWIPPDRSFIYGLFVRGTAVFAHSMIALAIAQSLLGVVSAILLFLILRDSFEAPFPLAFCAALLLAIEPAQLFYERMLMAESAGTMMFATMLWSGFAWLRRPHWAWALVWPLAGIACVALRMSALPVVVGFAALPVLVRIAIDRPFRSAINRFWPHLLIALVATAAMHSGYKHLYGHLERVHPDYIADTGAFRLGLVAPLVTRAEVVSVGLPADLLEHVGPPLSDPRLREAQIWQADGLISRVREAAHGDRRTLRELADRALRADPFGLVRMGWSTLTDYLDDGVARARMEDDIGNRTVDESMVAELNACCAYDASGLESRRNPVARYFSASRAWLTGCYFILAPLALSMLFAQRKRALAAPLLLALTACGLVLAMMLFSHIVSFRYLHPFPFMVILCGGALRVAVVARPVKSTATRTADVRST